MTPEPTPEGPRAPQNGPGHLDPATFAELQRLARSRPRSGRQSAAKASAIRTLERLERSRRRDGVPVSNDPAVIRLFDDARDPGERVRADDWCADMPEDFAALYSGETVATRRRWYLNLQKLGRL